LIRTASILLLTALTACGPTSAEEPTIVGTWKCAPPSIPDPAETILQLNDDGTGTGISRVNETDEIVWVASSKLDYELEKSDLFLNLSEHTLISYMVGGTPLTGDILKEKERDAFSDDTAETELFSIQTLSDTDLRFLATDNFTEVHCTSIDQIPEEFQ